MSSLAGALISPQPVSELSAPAGSFQPYSSEIPLSGDVDMQALSPDLTLKHEFGVEQDQEMGDLFDDGDAEAATADRDAISPGGSGDVSTHEKERRQALEYEEEEEESGAAQIPVIPIDVSIPNIPVPKSSDGNNWVIRMPNFVKVDSKPFHPDTYMGPEHDDDELQQAETLREKSMTIKLKVENTLRWRWIKDEMGNDRRQSNSRIIRWSDGSLSLRLGKELFDIKQSIDTSGGVPRQAFGSQPLQSQSLSQTESSPSQSHSAGVKSQGLTYLVAQHKHSQVLQSEALITGYMTLTPTGMQSETHRMLVRAVGQKHNKVARLRMAPDPITDPEREKMELMKQNAKKSKKKTDLDDGFGGGRRKRSGYSRKRTGHDVWSDDEDEERREFGASDEDDEDGLGGGIGSSPRKRNAAGEEKKGVGEYQEDDFVVPDSSEDEAKPEGDRSKKRKHLETEEEDVDEDPLEKMDAKINEQQEHEKRRRQRQSGELQAEDENLEAETDDGNGGNEEMDMESEEDEEEEFKVRRVGGSGGRKKRVIELDNDEDE